MTFPRGSLRMVHWQSEKSLVKFVTVSQSQFNLVELAVKSSKVRHTHCWFFVTEQTAYLAPSVVTLVLLKSKEV